MSGDANDGFDVAASETPDGEFAAVVADFEEMGLPPWHSLSVESARQLEDEAFSAGSGPEMQTVRNVEIDGPRGEIPLRVYRPDAENPPTLVFAHGGGWVLGTLDSADDICRELAARSGCLVVSVDYRLAPEHPFPAGLDDVFAALQWADEYAESFGASEGLAVAGTSAGGNLAAATALRARESDVTLDGQFLLYPMIDDDFQRPSYDEFAENSLLSRADVAWFWEQYCRSPVDRANPYAAVLEADPAGVAPATVLTAGHDVLRDEGAVYARLLAESGVDTDHDHYRSLGHGFLSLTDDVARADDAMDALTDRIRARLG
jgi:acetyl esterase